MSYQVTDARAIVVGAGASGLAAAELLRSRGARVTLNDQRTPAELGAAARRAEANGITLALGAHEPTLFETADLVVVSPGVPDNDGLRAAAAAGAEVIGEVELASRFLTGALVGITGTNGKSTVTTMVGDMLERSGVPTFVGGNLGTALSRAVGTDADREGGVLVVELSSFQLERVARLRPRVAALLNLSPDHLDRYPDFEAYGRAKANIFRAQGEGDHAVIPADDPGVRALAPSRPAPEVHEFDGAGGEVRIEADAIVDRETGFSFPVAELALAGKHNAVNACAAVLVARLAGAQAEAMAATLRELEGLPHRAALVRTIDGVDYVDDSKATNVGATVAALDGLAGPSRRAVLIAGGVDKGGSYAPMRERLEAVGRAVVLIGEATPLLAEALGALPIPIERAETMADAVEAAHRLAEPGDVVLLAPACSSFDMFDSYAQRGDAFVAAVEAIGGAA